MANIEGVIQAKKENLSNETINNIHRFLFDILAFFSNCPENLIEEYCQEIQNVCRKNLDKQIFCNYLF